MFWGVVHGEFDGNTNKPTSEGVATETAQSLRSTRGEILTVVQDTSPCDSAMWDFVSQFCVWHSH